MNNNHDTLNCLMEECAEVIQACSKIIRFGPSFKPMDDSELTTKDLLQNELGDMMALMDQLDLRTLEIAEAASYKLEKMKQWAPEALEERNDEPRYRPSHTS